MTSPPQKNMPVTPLGKLIDFDRLDFIIFVTPYPIALVRFGLYNNMLLDHNDTRILIAGQLLIFRIIFNSVIARVIVSFALAFVFRISQTHCAIVGPKSHIRDFAFFVFERT